MIKSSRPSITMNKVLMCRFCNRVDSNLSTFSKACGTTFCKNERNCHSKNLSDEKRNSKAFFDKKKEATATKDIDEIDYKAGKKSGKTKKKQQNNSDINNDVHSEILYKREKKIKQDELEVEKKSCCKPIDELEESTENSAGDLVTSECSSKGVPSDCFPIEENKRINENSSLDIDVGNCILVAEEKENSDEADIAEDLRGPINGRMDEAKLSKKKCGTCLLSGCSKQCSLCRITFYCSKSCQKKDWPNHKEICIKGLTEEEKEIFKIHKEKRRQKEDYKNCCRKFTEETDGLNNIMIDDSASNFDGSFDRMYQMLPLSQAMIIATRPEGSFRKALKMTREIFPFHDIIIAFDDVPIRLPFPFFPLVLQPRKGYVLLAFMYRFHENVIRHGVYLKDVNDEKIKVEFYLDALEDDPLPYFSYSKVKPGAYICLVDPTMQIFRDGTFGMRINDPRRVYILNI